jgi:hypothetical protein
MLSILIVDYGRAFQSRIVQAKKFHQEAYLLSCTHKQIICNMFEKSSPLCFYVTILKKEYFALVFIQAHRTRTFAMDHVNYARWMPVHIRDIKSIPDAIKDELENY